MARTTECLYSTVQNTSGATRKFSFLPPHGRELADDGQLTFVGHVADAIKRNQFNSKRCEDALIAALEAGDLEIVKTPNPVLFDANNAETKMLRLDSGTLYASDPCWLATSVSSSLGS
jgi:hypothetical protein